MNELQNLAELVRMKIKYDHALITVKKETIIICWIRFKQDDTGSYTLMDRKIRTTQQKDLPAFLQQLEAMSIDGKIDTHP